MKAAWLIPDRKLKPAIKPPRQYPPWLIPVISYIMVVVNCSLAFYFIGKKHGRAEMTDSVTDRHQLLDSLINEARIVVNRPSRVIIDVGQKDTQRIYGIDTSRLLRYEDMPGSLDSLEELMRPHISSGVNTPYYQ